DRNHSLAANAPGSAGKVAKAVNGHHCSRSKRRDVISGDQMAQVMLDVVHLTLKAIAGKCFGQQFTHVLPFSAVAKPLKDQRRIGTLPGEISKFAPEVGAAVLIERDMIQLAETDAGFAQAISDRLGGKSRPVLDAAKALFFRGGNQ